MACSRARGLKAGRNLVLYGTPIVCAGGKPLEVFSFLHGAAEGHGMAMAAQIEREVMMQTNQAPQNPQWNDKA